MLASVGGRRGTRTRATRPASARMSSLALSERTGLGRRLTHTRLNNSSADRRERYQKSRPRPRSPPRRHDPRACARTRAQSASRAPAERPRRNGGRTEVVVPRAPHRVDLLEPREHVDARQVELVALWSGRVALRLEEAHEEALVMDERVETPCERRVGASARTRERGEGARATHSDCRPPPRGAPRCPRSRAARSRRYLRKERVSEERRYTRREGVHRRLRATGGTATRSGRSGRTRSPA